MKTIQNHTLVEEVETGDEFGGHQKYYVFLKEGYIWQHKGHRTAGMDSVKQFLQEIKTVRKVPLGYRE